MQQGWAHPTAEPSNSHSESSDGAKVPREPRAEPGRDGEGSEQPLAPSPRAGRAEGAVRSPPRQQVSLGTEQRAGRQSSSPGSEVLPSTVPACEPCSRAGVLQDSADNAACPAHLGPAQHPTQPHHFRSSTQADFHPPAEPDGALPPLPNNSPGRTHGASSSSCRGAGALLHTLPGSPGTRSLPPGTSCGSAPF